MDEEYSVLAALVSGAHGVGGNVRLRFVGDQPDAAVRSLEGRGRVRLLSPEGGQARDVTLTSLRRQSQPKGAWLAHFREVKDRTEAEALVGWGIYIPEGARAGLPEGQYYVDHLVGLEVVTSNGKPLGHLTDVVYSPANDVYETDLGILIPAVPEFILSIDLGERRILVQDVPGLVDDL